MSLLTTEQQYEFGAKIQNLIMFVGLLSEDEIETLKKLREQLERDNATQSTVGGLLTPLNAAERKIARQNAMIKRINALIDIHESNLEINDAEKDFEKKEASQKKVNELFGL